MGGAAISTTLAVRGHLPLGVAIPLQAFWAYLAFTPAHEAMHGNVSGSDARFRGLESGIGWLMSAVLALPYSMLAYLHLKHHSHTNDPENDPDIRASGSSVPGVFFGCWTVQWGYARVFSRLLSQGSPGARDALRGMWAYGAVSLLLLGVSVRFGFWLWLVELWILPAFLAQGFLAFVFDWLPHHPHENRERYRDTRVILLPGLGFLLLGQSHHLVHHLYPRLPFYRYARCFAELRDHLESKGAPIEEPLRGR